MIKEENKLSRKQIFGFVAIAVLVVGLLGLFVAIQFDSSAKTDPNGEPVLPQCSDGIDNDGDGYTDENDDQCVSKTDNMEASMSGFVWFLIISGIIATVIIIVIYRKNNKNIDQNQDDSVLPKPIHPQRAWKLTLSWLLQYKFTDIRAWIEREKDGYELYYPVSEEYITIDNQFEHTDSKSNEKFMIYHISVSKGVWSGCHTLFISLQRGEQYLKDGVLRFEKGTWVGNWTRKSRTYNTGSVQDEKTRLQLMKVEAMHEGDKERLAEVDTVLSSMGTNQPSAFVDDLDDEEYKERLRIQAIQNNTTKKKDKKRTNSQMNPITTDSQNNVESNLLNQ
jgi:hypothetical protein